MLGYFSSLACWVWWWICVKLIFVWVCSYMPPAFVTHPSLLSANQHWKLHFFSCPLFYVRAVDHSNHVLSPLQFLYSNWIFPYFRRWPISALHDCQSSKQTSASAWIFREVRTALTGWIWERWKGTGTFIYLQQVIFQQRLIIRKCKQAKALYLF